MTLVAASAGDHDGAEQIAWSNTDPDDHPWALAHEAEVAASAGDHDGAEQIARSNTEPYWQSRALAHVAEAVGRAGDHDRARALTAAAEQAARSITNPEGRASSLTIVASVAEPARARSCIAGVLAAVRWTIPIRELARIEPAVLSAFADELTAPSPVKEAG